MPYYSSDVSPDGEIKKSYSKMLLLSKLFQLYNGNQALNVSMNMAYLLHFASSGTLQDIKSDCMNYVQLVAAIDGTAVDDDFQEDVDMDKKKGTGVNKVERIVNQHAEKEFNPEGNLGLIQELIG